MNNVKPGDQNTLKINDRDFLPAQKSKGPGNVNMDAPETLVAYLIMLVLIIFFLRRIYVKKKKI